MSPNRPTNRTVSINRNWTVLASLLLALGMSLAACEETAGPEGPEGPQGVEGPQGPQGPVGPAGEDGSQIYADNGAPDDGVGSEGDYFLNQQSGELYGPKNSDGWPGSPGLILYGEDGADGQDGTDGTDGEDGSQIYSGSGAPDLFLGSEGDYYLNLDTGSLYGPKTAGWGSPISLKGPEGNANVTRHTFPGKDFTTLLGFSRPIDVESKHEVAMSAWLVYLVYEDLSITRYFPVPGHGYNNDTWYGRDQHYDSDDSLSRLWFNFHKLDGPGEEYDAIYIIQVESSKFGKQGHGPIIPEDLDVSDYEAVAEYYGFGTQ